MIAVLKQGTNDTQIENLTSWLRTQGVDVHISRGKVHTVLGLVGDTANIDEELLANAEHIFRLTEEACATGSEKQLMNEIPALVTSEQEVSHDDQNA